MNLVALLPALANLSLIGALPLAYFRDGGRFNGRWWLTAAPFFGAGLALVLGLFGILAPVPGFMASTSRTLAALLAAVASILLILRSMAAHRRPPALWHQEQDLPEQLVTHGPYARIRHPLYSAFLLALCGTCFALPHPVTLLCFLWSAVTLNWTAEREERRLSDSPLGEAYRAYLRTTGRFLPRLRRGH